MIAEQYPMSAGKKIENMSVDYFYELLQDYCCIFEIELLDLKPRCMYENYISESKCKVCENAVVNNGRVFSADRVVIDITNIDFEIIQKVYSFRLGRYSDFYIYEKDYLPKSFVQCIIDLYKAKTTLKGVPGKEDEYMHGKENLNSTYGMTVTSIVRTIIDYNDEWTESELTAEEIENQVEKENGKRGRFLFYLWGVFVTAYARKNLWSGILECKTDYIYSDTDSVKITNAAAHQKYFNDYNKQIVEKLKKALKHHNIAVSEISPRTVEGKEKPLGVWDFDGFYADFKTLGAKRYLSCDEKGKYHLTVSGLGKQTALQYIIEQSKNPFDFFRDGMYIPPESTGKLTHTYIDDFFSENITDYQGNTCRVSELSYVHLESADYHLTLSRSYKDFLQGLRDFAHK